MNSADIPRAWKTGNGLRGLSPAKGTRAHLCRPRAPQTTRKPHSVPEWSWPGSPRDGGKGGSARVRHPQRRVSAPLQVRAETGCPEISRRNAADHAFHPGGGVLQKTNTRGPMYRTPLSPPGPEAAGASIFPQTGQMGPTIAQDKSEKKGQKK